MDKTLEYSLSVVYTPTDNSENQISRLSSKYKTPVVNNVVQEFETGHLELLEPLDPELIGKIKAPYPMGFANFELLEFNALCELVQSVMESLEIRTLSFSKNQLV